MTELIHTLERGDRFTVPALPDLPPLTFDCMDGMYCHATTDDGQVVHIKAWAERVRVDGGGDGGGG